MKCKHKVVQLWWRWFGTWIDHRPRLYSFERDGHDAETCLDCGAWLSLGPSDETEPNVALEIRAAEIAADASPHRLACSTPDESEGWRAHQTSGNPVNNPEHQSLSLRGWVASRHAGYLARQIATHGEDE